MRGSTVHNIQIALHRGLSTLALFISLDTKYYCTFNNNEVVTRGAASLSWSPSESGVGQGLPPGRIPGMRYYCQTRTDETSALAARTQQLRIDKQVKIS